MFGKNVLKKAKSNKGSAMIVSFIVVVILMMFALSLLLVSYSLYLSTVKENSKLQCKELAKTLSVELGNELTSVYFEDYASQKWAEDQVAVTGDHALWFYVRYNMWQSSWPYYNVDERGHTESYAFKDCKMLQETGDAISYDVNVTLYWESDREISASEKDDTPLYIVVEVAKGNQTYKVVSQYDLKVEEYPEIDNDTDTENTFSTTINPANNSIIKQEKWSFEFSERN